jgi:hypothetical protein
MRCDAIRRVFKRCDVADTTMQLLHLDQIKSNGRMVGLSGQGSRDASKQCVEINKDDIHAKHEANSAKLNAQCVKNRKKRTDVACKRGAASCSSPPRAPQDSLQHGQAAIDRPAFAAPPRCDRARYAEHKSPTFVALPYFLQIFLVLILTSDQPHVLDTSRVWTDALRDHDSAFSPCRAAGNGKHFPCQRIISIRWTKNSRPRAVT